MGGQEMPGLLRAMWYDLGRPRVVLDNGVTIYDLELWVSSPTQPGQEQMAQALEYLKLIKLWGV